MIERRTIGGFQVELPLQHLPLSPAIFSGFPGRLVAGETQPGRHVARDKLKGKARQGYFPERLGGARIVSGKLFHVDYFPATCRPKSVFK
ncbi:hypothetical protein Tco_1102357 [Tanacetum coccineum]